MHARHSNWEQCFRERSLITEKKILPYITPSFQVTSETAVAEMGCGEAGNLRPFLEMGCKATGIDISGTRIERARKFYADHPQKEKLILIAADVFSVFPEQTGKFDLILIPDTLEHIQNQQEFLTHTIKFLRPGGKIFLSFPPWRMPFGGHQQMCENKLLCKAPYFHLLPKHLYIGALKLLGEKPYRIQELMAIRDTRISIQKFKFLLSGTQLKIELEDFYLINPAYKIKFNLNTRKLPRFLNIPHLRDFFTTACYYIVS